MSKKKLKKKIKKLEREMIRTDDKIVWELSCLLSVFSNLIKDDKLICEKDLVRLIKRTEDILSYGSSDYQSGLMKYAQSTDPSSTIGKISKERQIAIEIMNEFEELLHKHNILIPDADREGHFDEASIYGSTYYDMEDKITCILNKFNNSSVTKIPPIEEDDDPCKIKIYTEVKKPL